jgi:hypothetical protein
MKKTKITNPLTTLLLQFADKTLPITVFINEHKEYDYHIPYPKVGRSHYYSMVNQIDTEFNQQYPDWYSVFHYQIRGEYHKIVIPNY